MVAIPIANDQPGVAARIIAWTGAGAAIPLKRLTVPRLRTAISQVLTQPSYKQNALRLQKAIKRAGGVTRAAAVAAALDPALLASTRILGVRLRAVRGTGRSEELAGGACCAVGRGT